MKWAALAIALASILPLAAWLRRNPHQVPKVWMLMGFLPFGVGGFHLYMAVISWPGWPGYVKGTELSVMDTLAVALYLSLRRTGSGVPFRLSMTFYFLAVLLSAFQNSVPMATFFYAWQLARVFLVYAVVAKASTDERVVPALLTGMMIGLCFEAAEAVWERFGLGILQTGGTLGHQNFLGLMSHFVTFPWVALLLAGEKGWRPIVGPVAGIVIAVLTVSRATLGLIGVGCFGLFSLSALRKWTPRKAMVLMAGLAALCALTPIALSSFEQRFKGETTASNYDERAAFERAATDIISDHPMGIGANNYVVVANVDGYNTKAGVAWVIGSDSANVHNVYYLVTAESGYIGLITFLLMLARPLIVGFRCASRSRADRRGDLLLGLSTSLLVVYIHSYFEWIFITFAAQYMWALEVGMVAGLATQLGYWRNYQANDRAPVTEPIIPVGGIVRN